MEIFVIKLSRVLSCPVVALLVVALLPCPLLVLIFYIYIIYLEFITHRPQDLGSPLLVAEKHRQANFTNTSPRIEDIESPRIKGIQAPL